MSQLDRKRSVVATAIVVPLLILSACIGTSDALSPNLQAISLCPGITIATEAQADLSSVDTARALSAAISEDDGAFSGLGFPSLQTLGLSSFFELWSYTNASCLPTVQSVNLVFFVQKGGQNLSLILSETPTLVEVRNVSIQATSATDLNHHNGFYTGYGVKTPNSPSGVWSVAAVSVPTGGCFNYCDVSPWIGQSPSATGVGGISQTGTESEIEVISGCCTIWSYVGWYEFLPAANVNCLTVSPGDWIQALSGYSGTQYSTTLVDVTSGHGCSAADTAGAIAAPAYTFFVEEEQWNPGCGCYLATPQFTTFDFTNVMVGSIGDLPAMSPGPYNYLSANQVGLGPMTYQNRSCTPVSTNTCFSEYYT